MAKVNLSVAEQREVRGFEKKIRRAINVLLKTGGRLGLNYLTPPSSDRVKSAVIRHFKEGFEISCNQQGVFYIEDVRVTIKKSR